MLPFSFVKAKKNPVVKGAYSAGNQSERRKISRDRALDQSDCRTPHLHIQDGAMMKKGCDVTSGFQIRRDRK